MVNVKRNWDLISDEKRKAAIKEIINFFANERSEEIGVIAAETILDFMLQMLAPSIYNKGVEDSVRFIKERLEILGPEMEALLKK